MRKSTMVTFTSGDRHRFEPPRTQTAFIVCPKVNAKKLPVRIFKVGNRVVFEPALAYKGPMHPAPRLYYTQGAFGGGLNTHI